MFQSHTILLVQPGKRPEARTYSDYESVNECLEGECSLWYTYMLGSIYFYSVLGSILKNTCQCEEFQIVPMTHVYMYDSIRVVYIYNHMYALYCKVYIHQK